MRVPSLSSITFSISPKKSSPDYFFTCNIRWIMTAASALDICVRVKRAMIPLLHEVSGLAAVALGGGKGMRMFLYSRYGVSRE